jgi:adenylate cyclase
MSKRACVTLQYFLQKELGKAQHWHKALLKTDDPENVHQLRICLRKLRSTLKFAKPLLKHGYRQRWQKRLRAASKQLDQARDLDVLLHTLKSQASADPAIHKRLTKQQHKAYAKLRKELAGGPFSRWRKLKKQLKQPQWVELHCRQPQFSLKKLASEELDRLYQHISEALAHLPELDMTALHRLRINCKALRYACEFAAPVLSSAQQAPFLNSLRLLQDHLGELHDASVQQALLAQLSASQVSGSSAVISDHSRENLAKELSQLVSLQRPWPSLR